MGSLALIKQFKVVFQQLFVDQKCSKFNKKLLEPNEITCLKVRCGEIQEHLISWSKMILDRPNRLGQVQIILGRVQIVLVRFKLDFPGLILIIWKFP